MRSAMVKTEKKPVKSATRKSHGSGKRKRMADIKPQIRDTISETISFVIKGKLTPIKPILIDNKFDILGKPSKKLNQPCGKIIKKRCKTGQKPNKPVTKKSPRQNSKAKSKVQTETAKNLSAQNSIRKSAEKILTHVISHNPMETTKKNTESLNISKNKKKAKPGKAKKDSEISNTTKTTEPKKVQTRKNIKESEVNQNILHKQVLQNEQSIDEFKKQQTIEELLKQVNEELTENKRAKIKKQKSKTKKEASAVKNQESRVDETKYDIKEETKSLNKQDDRKTIEPEIVVNDTEIPDDITLKELSESEKVSMSFSKIKTEVISDKEETTDSKSEKKKAYRKLKTKPKMTIMKKRVMSNSKDKHDDKKYTTKLFGFWNGPKRHRVASLNALAKVHCLYENETRGNLLDIIDEASKLQYVPRKDTGKGNSEVNVKREAETSDSSDAPSPIPTRTLRSAPGMRGMGKHWDMHDTSSSSDDHSDEEDLPVKKIKKEKPSSPEKADSGSEKEKTDKEKKRSRRQNELMMDLKDMVVRKRMASLNASAILAASYSVERRQPKTIKSDVDSDSYDGSSEEYFAASDTDIKQEDIKKEEDTKLIEVHTTPNKKVAVILNQDTDVTITGVYVNSTTRSTHHEGYCSIAGMQYRISATSHTQTAATAVATETLLQSSSSSAPDNSNSDSMPSSKSYTPLDALSNMQPPPGPGIQHNHPIIHGQQHLGPTQHVLPMPPHQVSPGLRHSCSSAFSSPHSTPTYQIQPGHHPPIQGEQGLVHAGYYQPAGPLISVPAQHGHGPGAPPVPAPLSKPTPLAGEVSPTSSSSSAAAVAASSAAHELPMQQPPPPPSSTGGESSDSEVIITSVTTAKEAGLQPQAPPAHHPHAYRYAQYPPTPPGYSYTHYPPYPYPTPPPNPTYAHHEPCYSYKYPPTSYRRYLTSAQYYPAAPGMQEIYPTPGQSQQNQQVVSVPPTSGGTGPAVPYPSQAGGPAGIPPGTLVETYPPPPPQPTLVETYQPPPPPHYYPPPPAGYGPPQPTCYTHSPTRAIPFINATYQSCPCPMQSCPKNVLTGPLTGDSKRSNVTSISKDSMPLPPVALALPLEPASATGPPSPARGSAGMPPPPSPAGATYQPPPLPTKHESQLPRTQEDCKRRKARVGKAMVRNNIAAGFQQQNTMLLMCNPSQNYIGAVKREIESPKEREVMEEKKEICISDEETKPTAQDIQESFQKIEETSKDTSKTVEPKEEKVDEKMEDKSESGCSVKVDLIQEILPPVISTVAENVKVKNMKRKLSMSKEKVPEPEVTPSPKKKRKLGSYKFFIKKDTNLIKINNGKRKLLEEIIAAAALTRSASKGKQVAVKRKLGAVKGGVKKRVKLTKPLVDSNVHNSEESKSKIETKIEVHPKSKVIKKQPVNSKSTAKSAAIVLDNLIAKNSIDRTIDSVISEVALRTPKESGALKFSKCGKSGKEPVVNKKSTNNKNTQSKVNKSENKIECKKSVTNRRKSKSMEVTLTQTVTKVPRRNLHVPRWSNGWRWEGEPYEAKVFINSDEMTLVRRCYPAMMHETGDKIVIRDCVLLKAGPRRNDLPFVAKIAALWENPEDGEMMMSLLWYYRPEHTEQGRLPADQPDEVFASRHKDSNSVACIDDKCYVLTFNEYCRYRKRYKRIEEGIDETLPCIPIPEPYPRSQRQPPTSQVSPEMVFFCRRVYDFRQKRIMKNPT